MKIKSILAAIGAFLSLLFFAIFKSYKQGKEEQKKEDNANAIKETLEIKKDENVRRTDDITAVRNRMRKYTRD
jgi:sortase (surface protein transpeptidase)